jgi:DNA-binding protein HU-beta
MALKKAVSKLAPARAKAAAKAPAVKAKAKTLKTKAVASRSVGAATTPTVTLKQIGAQLAEAHELPARQMDTVLKDLVAAIVKHVKKGAKVRITGIGILQVKKREARMGRSPATGEAIKIKASKKVALRVAKDLKEAI